MVEKDVFMELLKFKKLGLSSQCLDALRKKGFEEPTEIQEKVIPILLTEDVDLVGQAQTGTGKTAAFALPMIEKLMPGASHVQVLILAPTRELAVQVAEEINTLKGKKNFSICPVYGGQSIDVQLRKLKRGVDIVVGTPGRVIDHLNRKTLKLDKISYLVLDEADEMLNMGFIEDVEEIMKHTNSGKRTMLFSATMPPRIASIAKKYMADYTHVTVSKQQLTTSLTDQIYFEVNETDKFEALCRIIDIETEFYGIVFCRTKLNVEEVAHKLIDRGYDAEALHGDLSQNQRERILYKFKSGKVAILVATDVAARGLDINDLSHVINFALPQDPDSYVHRIGRTGRAGKEGTAITFVTPEEYRKLVFITRSTKSDIRKEKLPSVNEIIAVKKERIKSDIYNVMETESFDEYCGMAKDLLTNNDPVGVLAAVLKYSFGDEMDESNYNEIREVTLDKRGRSRLFVALGKVDDITPKKLVAFITEQTDVKPQVIKDVSICEKFSFITVPFREAEIILKVFKSKKKHGKRPMVEKARDEK